MPPVAFRCLICFALALVACAQTGSYAPTPTTASYSVGNFSKNNLQVIVRDLRAEREGSDGLVSAVQSEVMRSLSNSPRSGRFVLIVDVIEHRSYFTMGNWNSATRLRWRVHRVDGKVVGNGEANGEGHRSNMLGYATAKAVSQDAFNSVMSDLLSGLSAVPTA